MDTISGTYEYRIAEPPEMFRQLPALAKRLGVEPDTDASGGGRVLLYMKDGTKYDLFVLINAFLDRLDAISSPGGARRST